MTNIELAAALRLCGSDRTCDECLKCPFFEGCDPELCVPKMTAACATALENHESHMLALQKEIEKLRGQLEVERRPQWVSVSERLPSDEKPVLAYYGFDNDGSGYLGMMFVGVLSYFCFDPDPHWQNADIDLVVTHWMPLPDGPKEDA